MFRIKQIFQPRKIIYDSVEPYNFDSIGRYFYNCTPKSGDNIISDNIANDIDLDDIFEKIDNTTSRIGQQYFYAKLRTIGCKDELLRFNDLVSEFEKDDLLSARVKRRLLKLKSRDGYFLAELFQADYPCLGNLALPYVLTSLFFLFIFLSFFNSIFLLALFPVLIANAILHYLNKRNIEYYMRGASELSKTIKAAKHISEEKAVKDHFKSFGFFKNLKKIERKSRLIFAEKQNANEIIAVTLLFVELAEIAVNFEVIMFRHYLNDIVARRSDLNRLFEFIGEVDSAISVSELRARDRLTQPVFVNDKCFEATDLIHPLVDNCIPNSLELKGKSLLLTGSNMSGKTTFVRAVAINALLAQTIFCCYAKLYRAPYFKIFTSIRIADSVEEKTSYFLEEVLTIKEFVDHAGSNECCLFVLDEIFKGTNTLERISAGKSVLDFLSNSNHIVLASTHDTELADLLEDRGYDCHHFSEQIVDGKLNFDYRLHKGKLRTRNAIRILELYGYPNHIIQDAIKTQNYLSSAKEPSAY